MSFTDADISPHDGKPVEFYKFIGSAGTFCYTSDNEEQVLDGDVYYPTPVTRTGIETGSIVDTTMTMDINVPSNSDVARLYCLKTSPDALKVEVRKRHRDTSESVIEWQGYLLDVTVSTLWATLKTGSVIQDKLRNNVANIYYQRTCNHVLFDERCKVSRAAFTNTAEIVKVQNQLITVDNDGAADNSLKAGEITNTRTGEIRGIYSNENNVLRISYPFVDLKVGDTVELTYGCNHARLGDCKHRFNNVVNYGGFDFIPTMNPFTDLNPDTKITETIKKTYLRRYPTFDTRIR